jgi:hypothetical protein
MIIMKMFVFLHFPAPSGDPQNKRYQARKLCNIEDPYSSQSKKPFLPSLANPFLSSAIMEITALSLDKIIDANI